jgi:sulfate adenylyltransferase
LIEPYGGELVQLVASPERAQELKAEAGGLPSWDLTERQLCDLELLLDGALSPLSGFLGSRDFAAVCASMRLADGTLWPIPITLDVTDELAGGLGPGARLALRDPEGVLLAVLTVDDLWAIDRDAKAQAVYGTRDRTHPGVAHLYERTNNAAVGGAVEGVERPRHYDFVRLRHTPAEVRERFRRLGWRKVIAFQTRNPMHRAHFELTLRAAREREANLLVHPAVGMTRPGDLDHYIRTRCYQALIARYPRNTALLSLLPLAMRMGGPREALLHAIIRKNYGCTHLIVGRDHAGPGNDSDGRPFYGPYDAQELFRQHEEELGIGMVPFRQMVYVEARDAYLPEDEVPDGVRVLAISGTELRRRLAEGREIPEWFTFPEVATELRRGYPPRDQQGFTVFFTGLSGAGKSTIANVLRVKLLEMGGRPVTLLDGDIVRCHLSSELGFSKEHRDVNIRRIGFVASEITKNGGIALCAPIAPYEATRREVRRMVEAGGGFMLVHVATPLEICEVRDRKGLYAKARAGVIADFTGVSDPYEPPGDPDLVLDTTALTPEECAQTIVMHLENERYISP